MMVELKAWIKEHARLLFLARLLKRILLVNQIHALLSIIDSSVRLAYQCAWLYCLGRSRIPRTLEAPRDAEIVMLVWSFLPADPRVEREARALAQQGFRVKILCPEWCDPASIEIPDWGPSIRIQVLPSAVKATLADFPWMISAGMLAAGLAENPWAFHAHDLNMALSALKVAAAKKTLCICDFHEWYSESVTYNDAKQRYEPHSLLKRTVCRIVERLALRCASRVITVCDSIAEELTVTYKPEVAVAVVRNIPPITKQECESKPTINLRQTLKIPEDKAILLYQGGIGPSRGLEPLIAAMAKVKHAVLVIRGPGLEGFSAGYMQLAHSVGAASVVHCVAPVPSNRCVAEAASADLGFWTLMPICKNFTYALPNKVFEYLSAGLPLVCAHHPEVKSIVERYDVGRCFDPESSDSIAAAIDALAGNPVSMNRCKSNIAMSLDDLQASKEWRKLVELYENLRPQCSVNQNERTSMAA